jgi:hypothetical protein
MLGRGDGGSASPLIGHTEPVTKFIAKPHLGEDESVGVARSAVFVIPGKADDAPWSPLGSGDDNNCARLSYTAVVKSDHRAPSHFGDDSSGVVGFGAKMSVDYRVEVDTDATDLWLSGLKQNARTLYM